MTPLAATTTSQSCSFHSTDGIDGRPEYRRSTLWNRIVLGVTAICLFAIGLSPVSGQETTDSFPVSINVKAGDPMGPLPPIWRFFGADEPNYATMPDGKTLLGHLGQLRPRQMYFRAHNLLTTGDGTPDLKWGSTNAYTEDADGNPIYDWTIVDGIFDAYLAQGVRPYVEIGFMPQALSRKPEPYRHHWHPGAKYEEIYTGWAYPPTDYGKWEELVYQWVHHCVQRYGRDEVETWYWQTWNEANIGYWRGTQEEFHRLHDHAVRGVRRALPTARVGGSDCAGGGGDFQRRFLEHCLDGKNLATGETGTPLDFISFHAKGWPTHEDGHVRMGIGRQLRDIDEGFRIVASYPEARDLPIVIGESDPEGCAACQGDHLQYRNGTMYSSYTAASFTRKLDLARQHGVQLEGALSWSFEFEDQPYFAGFRAMATRGIDKPVLNVFRMFSRMGETRLPVQSDHAIALQEMMEKSVRDQPDVSALAAISDSQRQITVLVWHYHDDDLPGPDARIALNLQQLPVDDGSVQITHHRIDEHHSNAFTLWKAMGSPQEPTEDQIAYLKQNDGLQLLTPPTWARISEGRLRLDVALPRQAVSLITLNW